MDRLNRIWKSKIVAIIFCAAIAITLIEFHTINKPVEERSVQRTDAWYKVLIGDTKDLVRDVANNNFVIIKKITNGEPIEPFHAKKAGNENTPVAAASSNEVYTGQTTFIAEWPGPGWYPYRQGSVDVEYDFDGDGVVDYVDHVEYNGLTPGKQYTIQGRLIPKSSAEGVVHSTLIDENENQVNIDKHIS